jgi:MFS family permease
MQVSGTVSGPRWRWIDLRVLLACHLGLSAAISPAFFGVFGLFLKPIGDDLGWSRGEVAVGLSIVSIIAIGSSAISGLFVDRWGSRLVTLLAGIGLPCGIVWMALSLPSWPAFVCSAIFIGLIAGPASPGAYLSVISRWFDRRLGLAIAISVSGLGVGQVLNTLVLNQLIGPLGWRHSWLALAIMVAVFGLTAHALVPWRSLSQIAPPRGPSMRHGLEDSQGEAAQQQLFWRQPSFWALSLAFMLVLLVTAAVQVNVAAALADRQQLYLVPVVMTTLGVASFIARLVGGALLDIFPVRWVGVPVFMLQCIGCILLFTTTSPVAMVAAVFMISFAFGVESDILPFIARRRYGIAQFGKAYGIMFGSVQLGPVIGPLTVAWAYDKFGNYDLAFTALAVCSAVATVLFVLALGRSGGAVSASPKPI